MANATKATKTLTSGSKAMLVMEPQVYFQRKTNLPANWLRCRIGIIGSFTNAAGLNSLPTTEQINFNTNPKFRFMFGLSNGVAFPGEATNRFVGFRSQGQASGDLKIEDTGAPTWRLTTSGGTAFSGVPHVNDGTSIATPLGFLPSVNLTFPDPTATSGCMFALAMDVDTRTSGELILQYLSTPGNLSDASDAALSGFLTSGTYGTTQGTVTGAPVWWDGSTTFCGLQYLAVRSPFTANRLRIMNMMVIQTA